MTTVLRGKFIALSAFLKKLERSYTTSLTAYLRALIQKESNTPKRNISEEIMKLRDEVNQVETQKIYKEPTKPGAGSLKK